MCRVLKVSRSGFYAWRKRPESKAAKRRSQLVSEMKVVHADRDMKNYGSPRMRSELVDRGHRVSENTVAKLMKSHGLRAARSRKFRVTTDSRHSHPVAENVLNREFEQPSPDRVWVADITYIWTDEGWLYLACVLDVWSRMIVGWSMSERMEKSLVIDAMTSALQRRHPNGSKLLHHSDRGSQYASESFRKLLSDSNITCSMSRKGNCWDNAMMESFFATLKSERVHQERYTTRSEARSSIFDYIERFYNRKRRHSALGNLSPEQYEQRL